RVNDLPWFCADALPAHDPPQCPTGALCVYGNYQPVGGIYGEYPVCIAHASFHPSNGTVASLFGGSFVDMKADRNHIGHVGRRIEKNPTGESLARNYGFRCVGDQGVTDEVVPQ